MLTVMVIIGILIGLGNSLFNDPAGPRLQTSIRSGMAAFDQARSAAIAKGRSVRVLVHIDVSDVERCYRTIRFITDAEDEEPDEDLWESYTTDLILPEGVYFDRDSVDAGSVALETMEFDPNTGLAGSGSGQSYYYYEFSSMGSCLQPGARIVLTGGSINGDGTLNRIPGLLDGFVISAIGRPIRFREPDQI